ncbi:sulfurtransferase TusA family protein [Neptunicella sp. SCSIO 80796]|uniref:sulfurtransferase TusA family protein n=1 Tax=Neptunicella plasticusilytica TaxID=3117012 RepID=UPI003A4DB2DD
MPHLDVSHLKCPLALLQVKRWLAGCVPGQQVELTISRTIDSQDILRFIVVSEHRIVMQNEDNNTVQLFVVIHH